MNLEVLMCLGNIFPKTDLKVSGSNFHVLKIGGLTADLENDHLAKS